MKYYSWKCSLLGAVSAFAFTAQAADTASLRVASELAWQRHPQAAAFDARELEARAAQELAANLTPQAGSLSIGKRNDRLNRNLGQREIEVELATPLWLPGQRAAHGQQAASQLAETLAKRAALRWQIAGEVREAWWNLAQARNAMALAARRLETATALQTDVQRRYAAGDLSRIDANLALGEVHAAGGELLESETALAQAEQDFSLLTGIAPPAAFSEEQRAAGDLLQEAHPLIALAHSSTQSARAGARLAALSGRAAPELALTMLRERGAFNEAYANSVGIQLKIPFSSGAQKRQASAASLADTLQAESELQQVRQRVQLTVSQLLRLQSSLASQLTMAEQSRALAVENLALAEKAFKLGETDLAALLRMRAAAFQAEAVLERQRLARSALTSRLNQAFGVLP